MTTAPALPEQPLIAVDVVPVRYLPSRGFVELFLGKRLYEPSRGAFALPGVLLGERVPLSDPDKAGDRIENTDEAARRALRSKATIVNARLFDLGVFEGDENSARDPRGETVSISKLAVVPAAYSPDGEQAILSPLSATGLPFDHDEIVDAAARMIEQQLLVDADLTHALVGDRFTLSDLQAIQRDVAARVDDAEVRRPTTKRHPSRDLEELRLRRLERTGWFDKVEPETLAAESEEQARLAALANPGSAKEAPKGRGRPQIVWKWRETQP